MKTGATWVVLLLLTGAVPAAAERARTAADATVFIRVSVSLHAEVVGGPGLSRVDVEMELYGSGFVISAYGHVLTNHHVVTPKLEQFVFEQSGVKATGTLSVARIAVCFPREAAVWDDLVAQAGPDETKCLDAFVVAQDETLDLAVLSVSASNLPYLGFGDSDAVVVGQAEDALGFPLGALLVEVGKAADVVPAITRTPGAISALRMGCGTGARRGPCVSAADRARERRFFQISNGVNAGNSGGPVVDRNGFAIGVVQTKIADVDGEPVEGIGFAIPINVVKEFLEDRGLDSALPVRRLRPGPLHVLDPKRLRLSLPDGLTDVAPLATHVETDPQQAGLSLRIDRVLSPWTTQRLEEELLGTSVFERGSWAAHESRVASRTGRAPLLAGRATGELTDAAGEDAWMLYGILDLGAEKLVARYIGSAEWLAFNESVLANSVASLDGQRFPVPDAASVERLEWLPATDANGQPALPIPIGWTIAADGPTACARLPRPATVGAASAADDFSV